MLKGLKKKKKDESLKPNSVYSRGLRVVKKIKQMSEIEQTFLSAPSEQQSKHSFIIFVRITNHGSRERGLPILGRT